MGTYSGALWLLFAAVFRLGSTTVGVFVARRTGGGGDAVEAGRHPPADGRTPEARHAASCRRGAAAARAAACRRYDPEPPAHPEAPEQEVKLHFAPGAFRENTGKKADASSEDVSGSVSLM